MYAIILMIALVGGDTQYRHSYIYEPGSFKQHWGRVAKHAHSFPEKRTIVTPIELITPAKRFRAVMTVSDVTNVAYDQAVASIEIERFNGDKTYLIMKHFRDIKAYWLNDRLLFIKSDLVLALSRFLMPRLANGSISRAFRIPSCSTHSSSRGNNVKQQMVNKSLNQTRISRTS